MRNRCSFICAVNGEVACSRSTEAVGTYRYHRMYRPLGSLSGGLAGLVNVYTTAAPPPLVLVCDDLAEWVPLKAKSVEMDTVPPGAGSPASGASAVSKSLL